LACGGRVRAEGGADVRVIEVVAVAQHDCRAFRGGQPLGEVLELRECRAVVLGDELGQLGGGPRTTVLVDDDPARDRESPRSKVFGMAQLGIGAERAEERLLERIFGSLAAEASDEEREDLIPVLCVEALEGRQPHVGIL